MKKAIAFAAVAALTITASAGTVIWQCYDVTDKAGTAYIDGGKAYLFIGDNVSGVASAIQNGTFDYSAALRDSATDDEGCVEVKKIGKTAGDTAGWTSEDLSLYMVVFDTATVTSASNFKVSEVVTKSFGTSGNQTYKFTDSIASASWTPVSVPEPTTVALLALGLAAVGLKRKVA